MDMKEKVVKAAAAVKHTLAVDGEQHEVDGASVIEAVWPSTMLPGAWRVALAGDHDLVWKTLAELTAHQGWTLDTRYPTILIRL
jgi:hypothetical protein